jgi:hypothetical protein
MSGLTIRPSALEDLIEVCDYIMSICFDLNQIATTTSRWFGARWGYGLQGSTSDIREFDV